MSFEKFRQAIAACEHLAIDERDVISISHYGGDANVLLDSELAKTMDQMELRSEGSHTHAQWIDDDGIRFCSNWPKEQA